MPRRFWAPGWVASTSTASTIDPAIGPTTTSGRVTRGLMLTAKTPDELCFPYFARVVVKSSATTCVRAAPVSRMKRYGRPAILPSTMTSAHSGSSGSGSTISGIRVMAKPYGGDYRPFGHRHDRAPHQQKRMSDVGCSSRLRRRFWSLDSVLLAEWNDLDLVAGVRLRMLLGAFFLERLACLLGHVLSRRFVGHGAPWLEARLTPRFDDTPRPCR